MYSKDNCYQIGKKLGKGALGVVYQARDPHIDRLVALKIFHLDLVINNKDFYYSLSFYFDNYENSIQLRGARIEYIVESPLP